MIAVTEVPAKEEESEDLNEFSFLNKKRKQEFPFSLHSRAMHDPANYEER